MDIRISPDWSEIVLFLEGKEMIHVGKNGRTKNYDLQKRWKEQKKLPAYYIGEWDEEEELWYGKYLPYNPNRGEKQLKKWRDVFVKVVYEVRYSWKNRAGEERRNAAFSSGDLLCCGRKSVKIEHRK